MQYIKLKISQFDSSCTSQKRMTITENTPYNFKYTARIQSLETSCSILEKYKIVHIPRIQRFKLYLLKQLFQLD